VRTGTLSLYVFGNRGLFVILYGLLEPFHFTDHKGKRWTVPCRDAGAAQFITDGASFPWWLKFVPLVLMVCALASHMLLAGPIDFDTLWRAFFWAVVAQAFIGYPIHLAYSEAGVAHDYLYFLGVPKAYADAVFFWLIVARALSLYRESARCAPARWVILAYRLARACVMWLAVAVFGWGAYLEHARRRRAQAAG
jgi:hypothetical protein